MLLRYRNPLGAALALAGAFFASPAGADPVSSAFDGRYEGSGQLLAHLSQSGCAKAPDAVDMAIVKGSIQGKTVDGGRINGLMTSDGFFTGTYRFADGARSAIEGRIDGGSLVGSVIKSETCAYLLSLDKR
jgi:hypothetical protein